ncbi:hypothetical protein EJ05DRAFT_390392 [Pseudovirgaria hyperparasitica]|uniref:Uncharacterized protein n=1 Tax=Pseudovirgaria hyperparasitica TaxID=470096 RepID=A0A6A6W8Q1_9PEZI|nr:uncharacterized protein EJ05DRAFT_390392 [Pseudovirgaria hyperparasitica]KAF2757461.1 hypothetical protein EJ05DRAFT_390392 [Pseudovirgaria hyperparasitica]
MAYAGVSRLSRLKSISKQYHCLRCASLASLFPVNTFAFVHAEPKTKDPRREDKNPCTPSLYPSRWRILHDRRNAVLVVFILFRSLKSLFAGTNKPGSHRMTC